MRPERGALDILIEDLALQVLSAETATYQSEILEERLLQALNQRPTARAGRRSTGSTNRLEVERFLTGMAGRSGERFQETRSLALTLKWNLRRYLALRGSSPRAGPSKAPRGAGSRRSAR